MSIEINVICDKCKDFIHDAGYSIANARENARDEYKWIAIGSNKWEIRDLCLNCAEKIK